MNLEELMLNVDQQIIINAPAAAVFEGMLKRLAEENVRPDGVPMPMVLERWPGGRWYRDLGENSGHLWGFVQVIKAPQILEIYGPLFMSYPVSGHLQIRLEEISEGTQVSLRHRALGQIEEAHREGVTQGWDHYLNSIKTDSEA
ncbi:MAG: SRPBCC domain-containing protein [Gimesia sp.]|nr:SRPBCC domain-containing protein [Gimesia sp.]